MRFSFTTVAYTVVGMVCFGVVSWVLAAGVMQQETEASTPVMTKEELAAQIAIDREKDRIRRKIAENRDRMIKTK